LPNTTGKFHGFFCGADFLEKIKALQNESFLSVVNVAENHAGIGRHSREAFQLCSGSLPGVVRNGDELESRAGMLLGAALAGLAVENSMLGAAHAAANPLTAHFQIVHGQAVGLMLPRVVRFNAEHSETARLYEALHGGGIGRLISRLDWLLNLAGMPRSLGECPVNPAAIPSLAAEAAKQWTAAFNPRPLAEADFARLYQAAFQTRGDGAP
jgi:alcohol dehydrogenase